MHKKAFYLTLVCLFVFFSLFAGWMLAIRDEDRQAWKTLKSKQTDKSQGQGETSFSDSRQNKEQVRRELWTNADGSRLHTRIDSQFSTLMFNRQEDGTVAPGESAKVQPVEEMQGVVAYMQESIQSDSAFKTASQFLRVMVAKTASFYFKEDRMVAEDVNLYRFKLPGTVLPLIFPTEKPLIEGEAKWIELFLKEGKLDVNASQVKLAVPKKDGSLVSETLSTNSLLFDGRLARLNGEVIFNHALGKAESDEGEIVIEKANDSERGMISSILLKNHVVLTRPDGGQLFSDLIDLDFNKEKAFFKPVKWKTVSKDGQNLQLKAQKGTAFLVFEKPAEPSSKAGQWSFSEIELLGDVYISEDGRGTLATDQKVRVFKGPKSIEKVLCEGPSILNRVDQKKGRTHKIYTPGLATLDLNQNQTLLNRSESEQIHFVDTYGEIYADEIKLIYGNQTGAKDLKVKKIYLEGKVFFAQFLPGEKDRSYAYADKAEYDPETMEMILEGNSSKDRVLVFDRVNQLEVSAPKLRIKRDQVTKKETIKGEGDVKFRLDEKEFQALKNRFKLEDKDEPNKVEN